MSSDSPPEAGGATDSGDREARADTAIVTLT